MCCQFSHIVCFLCIASEKLFKELERRKVVTKINKSRELRHVMKEKKMMRVENA